MCPQCSAQSSDSAWPADGWGNFVTQRQVDATRGTEDPASVIQRGELMFRCPCSEAIWIANVGWLQAAWTDPNPAS